MRKKANKKISCNIIIHVCKNMKQTKPQPINPNERNKNKTNKYSYNETSNPYTQFTIKRAA